MKSVAGFGLLLAGIAIWYLLLPGLSGAVSEWRYAREGQIARGTVVKKYERNFACGRGQISDGKVRYVCLIEQKRVAYQFTIPQGQALQGESTVGEDRWRSLTEGGTVGIRYLPRDPSYSRVDGTSEWFWWFIYLAGGTVLLVVPLALPAFVLYDKWTQWRYSRSPEFRAKLKAKWAEALGTITAVEKTSEGYAIHYTYQDHNGQIHKGLDELMEDEYKGWKVGEQVTVGFKRRSPEKASIDVE